MENNKIDVCINVYGKPYQTLVSLKSLLNHSSKYIDKIYFIEEANQPRNDDFNWVFDELGYPNLIHFRPKFHLWVNPTDINRCIVDKDYRESLRYQYGFEKTDKKYILLIHNDVIFTSDIIKPFLENIKDGFGIGLIGQCWNCPLFYDNLCDGYRFNDAQLNYNEVIFSVRKHPNSRSFIYQNKIDQFNPKPMPECRINEWCCLVDVEKYKQNVIPNGNVLPFGGYFKVDLADAWFEGMYKLGYKAVFYNIYKNMKHGYFSNTKETTEYCLNSHNGHSAMFDGDKYLMEEEEAKIIYKRIKNGNIDSNR